MKSARIPGIYAGEYVNLTFQRPHGRYSKCDGCRAKIRRARHQKLRETAERRQAAGKKLDEHWQSFVGHVCGRVC